ncbi:nuclease-related domain-containing protein [Fibrobacter intestinalis]
MYLLWFANKVLFEYDFIPLANWNWFAWLIAAVIVVLLLAVGYFVIIRPLEKLIDYLDNKVASYKKGFEGEDHVVDALRESLDGRCHVFRNLHFNGRKEDVDVVLVSPWGVFAIEVKNYSGHFEYSGTEFFEKRKSGLVKVCEDSNPILQAKRNAVALKGFLDPEFNRNKDNAFVEPILVWANPEIKVYRQKRNDSQALCDKEIKNWRIEDLSFELDSIRCKKQLSEKAQREIIKKLEKCYR